MQTAIKYYTRVLPGKRIEFTSPDLVEGEEIEFVLLKAERKFSSAIQEPKVLGVWDYIQSLPPISRSLEEWEELERELRAERDSWDS